MYNSVHRVGLQKVVPWIETVGVLVVVVTAAVVVAVVAADDVDAD